MFTDLWHFLFWQNEIEKYDQICKKAYDDSKGILVNKNSEWLDSPWGDFFVNKDQMKVAPTGISEDIVQKLGVQASTYPKDLEIHSSKSLIQYMSKNSL